MSDQRRDWTVELMFAGGLGAWLVYEFYGRRIIEWLHMWSFHLRIAGAVLFALFLYWQFRMRPEEFTVDTLDVAKQLLMKGGGSGTAEKRNVSSLLKKKIAASQQWQCGSCNKTLDETYEVDHRIALFNGGSNDPSNLVALCPHCHRKKTVEERLA
jgi:hypothetical protein